MRSCFGLLLLVALVAGCADTSREEPAAAAAPAARTTQSHPQYLRDRGRDVAWLARLHRWEMNLRQDGTKVSSIWRGVGSGARTRRELREPLRELSRCERRLLGQVGEPAAARYRTGYDLLRKGCQSIKHIAFRLVQALDQRKRPPMAEVDRESEKSTAFFKRGSANLEHTLRANRQLPVTSGSRAESKIEPRLSRFASRLVTRKATGIEVRCWSKREWSIVKEEWGAYIGRQDILGFVHSLLPRTNIAPKVCRQLALFVYHDERPTSGLPLLKIADSVGILAHESEHIRNIRGDEATTECHGMQHLRRLARIMGASKSYADLLASTYWDEIYPLNHPEYRTPLCRDQGTLDLHPGSDIWP